MTIRGSVNDLLGLNQTSSQPSSVQEYEYAKAQGYTGSFNDYQNLDANRKIAIAKAGVGTSGLSTSEANIFNSMVSKYNSSPLIAAADRTIVLKSAVNEVKKDPTNGAKQLSLVYAYIQALDTYQSAVREGELALVNSLQSKSRPIWRMGWIFWGTS